MKIYVASSWRNPWQIGVVRLLRGRGHDVYDFRQPAPEENGFHWSEIDGGWKTWNPRTYREALKHPVAEHGFKRDMDALRSCDACVLVLPCGNSAHLELGWAVGAGKRTAVLFPHGVSMPTDKEARAFGHSLHHLVACSGCGDFDGCHVPAKLDKIEPELMAKCADAVLVSADELTKWLETR